MYGSSLEFSDRGPRALRKSSPATLLTAVIAVVAGANGVAVGSSVPAGASTRTAASSRAVSISATTSASKAAGSCAGVRGPHHARVVVEPAAGKEVARCVGFGGKSIAALALLQESRIEIGTQKFSFGVAICQVDHVPAHYTQCLPSGQDYWALFVSKSGQKWTSPSVGVSDIRVFPGGSLGLRYDSPKGTPPPPRPTPA
ncbi:MAG: hypothetical protein ACRDXC_12505 [Acidimicrobiales bacterium]